MPVLRFMVGLNDFKGLFQPKCLCDSMVLYIRIVHKGCSCLLSIYSLLKNDLFGF